MQRARRRFVHDWDWHEERLSEGPHGFIRERGVKSWDELHQTCQRLTESWERLPEPVRRGYAYPNPEDRRL